MRPVIPDLRPSPGPLLSPPRVRRILFSVVFVLEMFFVVFVGMMLLVLSNIDMGEWCRDSCPDRSPERIAIARTYCETTGYENWAGFARADPDNPFVWTPYGNQPPLKRVLGPETKAEFVKHCLAAQLG